MAIARVTTPFIFMHQHDLVLKKPFDLNGIIAPMVANQNIKHVHLKGAPFNNCEPWWDGPVDQVIFGLHFVPLCRTFGWSDQSHISRVEYYRDFVLPQCGRGFMEGFLHYGLKKSIEQCCYDLDEAHAPFGTYLYGDPSDGGYIYHSNGRR